MCCNRIPSTTLRTTNGTIPRARLRTTDGTILPYNAMVSQKDYVAANVAM